MAGYGWTDEEEALVIWFASTGLTHITITRLLFQRGYLRTMLGVRNKITAIRKQDALGDASNRLELDEVDEWIKQLHTKSDILHILKPTTQDQEIVNAEGTKVDLLSIFKTRYPNALPQYEHWMNN